MFADFDDGDEFVDSMDNPLWAPVDPQEVQAVVSVLDDLIEQVEDETIQIYLHAACDEIRQLVPEEDDDALAA